MADALLGVVSENLTSLLQNEFATISGIRSKARKLSDNLVHIKAVLEDAEKKQFKELSIKQWLQDLKDAVYVLGDILDEYSIESGRLRGFNSFKPMNIAFRHEIGSRFKEITRRLDDIAESKNKFSLQMGGTLREIPDQVAEGRQTSSTPLESKALGRDDDKKKIVEFLLTHAKDSDFISVYPIVGLGGIGKTTLVQLVYNDDRVSGNFDKRIWVCVSETFSFERILRSIIESITLEKCPDFDLDVLERKVQGLLQGKIYLLILDDVWNQNDQLESGLTPDIWTRLKSVLSCGSKGSSILVSTRDKDVATIMGTCQAHSLSGLSYSDCWLLFKQHAFRHYREEHTKLVEIGKEIVKKCNGLPLAAKALGGLMVSMNEEKEWRDIKDNDLWALPQEKSILPALRLSYFYLTPTLKQCFSFCAIFPKDREILKEELIQLWMANGLISSMGNLDVEDVGNMVWKELYQKSFFQEIKIDEYSRDIYFKMHDLVYDLLHSVVGKECMYLEDKNVTNLSRSTHHIGFDYTDLLSINKGAFKEVESLRTLFQLSDYHHYSKIDHDYIPTNLSLRVLRTSFTHVRSLESLIHLRYLELRNLVIKELPDSIYNLQKLETLKIIRCDNLSCLPKHLACLQNLRHIVIEDCWSLSRMFPSIGKLSCLRTLSVYIVSLKKGNSLTELRDLKLGGKLSIKGLKDVGSISEAQEANLMGKKDLHELCLSWESNDKFTKPPTVSAEKVLEVLQPQSNLKCLEINCYDGLWLPSWIIILSNLVSFELENCNEIVQLPLIGKLPSLKKLTISGMYNLKYLDDDESRDGREVRVFPSLEVLDLFCLQNIEGLLKVERGEMFPCLSKLKISKCPKLGMPCLPSLKSLDVDPCNNELLRSISTFRGLTQLSLLDSEEIITSFPDGMFKNLTSLQSLVLNYFTNLKELPNEPFNPALKHLDISRCRELESLPEQIWEGLQSLRTLGISYCKGLQCLPEGIQHLTFLRTLKIWGCEGLQCLPEGIQHLTSLELLTIGYCPTLKLRCKEGTGEDWDKIAHIPKRDIREF
ncbi:putative P-loop containing nucleoside triphosphate hydrolase, leucine-rich repeat domain, L [Medicago truncatula]|uniref:LRR and NB-ARC domain disease resistance protein n=1 Tax=Medicago truncatula TaxID=3880 RepID=G7JM50_MEDTR|nr:putative disease resistance protein RGA1 [Medicago truncatula]XP_024638366.1 putative disease resistance protein RGA1 [Medicago truncatula]XP_039689352.1 putative disease resistance protein RGA1 [Medicago truncatula]XP_039689353.1 putative disease resistance protein RGA1 [Medicago truncatula]XP_039689354.1 putative disease resistance protein RGA1 [Medicago truncatula]XP_039689355.1 putative disease resistance protein RGA1 [Medicago truncatula]XP_039689356.1 putative disease resistance prot